MTKQWDDSENEVMIENGSGFADFSIKSYGPLLLTFLV